MNKLRMSVGEITTKTGNRMLAAQILLRSILNDQAGVAFKWTNGRAAQIIIVNYLI